MAASRPDSQYRNEISKAISVFSGPTYPITLLGMLLDLTESEKYVRAASKTSISSVEGAILDFPLPI